MKVIINKPSCVSPLLIVNRSAINLVYHGGILYLNNQKSIIVNRFNINDFNIKALFHVVEGKEHLLPFCYVQKGDYVEPLFIYVPCNHCELCASRKQIDFTNRCLMESQLYDCPPYMFTLTYKPSCLPPRGDLRYYDVQCFFKRLRRLWDRKGLEHNCRYVVSCEYGHRTHRAHYHVILFNNPYHANELIPSLHNQLKMDIFNSWGMCDMSGFDFGQCRGGAASYAAKYLGKPNVSYGHLIPPSVHASNGHGGIGSQFILSKLDYHHKNPHLREFSFIDKFSGNYKQILFGSYITSKLFPSPSRLVPNSVRDSYKQFCDLCQLGFSLGFLSLEQVRTYTDLLRPYKNVMTNKFSFSKARALKRPLFGLCYIYYRQRFIRLLDYFSDILCVVDTIPDSYIELYKKFKSFTSETKIEDSTSLTFSVKQKVSSMLDRSSF